MGRRDCPLVSKDSSRQLDEEAGFEAGGAEDGLLGEGDALEGEEFLGVDGVVEVR